MATTGGVQRSPNSGDREVRDPIKSSIALLFNNRSHEIFASAC
jgi:hypothetical protein